MSSQIASTPKKPARGPNSKQIGPSDYCRILGCCLFVDSTGQSSRSRKALKATESTENLFIESVRGSVAKRKFANRRFIVK